MMKLSGQWNVFLIRVALVLLTFAAFAQVLGNEFVNYDDTKYITDNPHVKKGLTGESVIWAFTESHFFMWHPLTSLSHMLDCSLYGLNPSGHHLTNLILHTASVLMLFGILRKMTGKIWAAAFVAAAFALHPLDVESVAWAAERKNVLSGFFWMLTIAAYIRYTKHQRVADYLLIILVFSCALMSKPTTVTLPFVLLLLDYWPLGRFRWKRQNQETSLWRLVAEKIPLLVLSAILCVITVVTQKGGGVLKATEILSFGIRMANALVSYVSYIGKMIYPTRLAVFYPHPAFNLPVWKPIVSLIVLVAVSAVIVYFGRRRPYLITGWLWYIGTLVPVIGIVQSGGQAMADRYTYLPEIGIFIMVAWGASELFAERRYRKIMLGTSAAILLASMMICTRVQVGYWKNSATLASHALEVTKNNDIMHNSYGCALFEQDRFDEALSQFNIALKINPHNRLAHGNMGKVYANMGVVYAQRGQSNLAVKYLTGAARLKPDDPDVLNDLAWVLATTKNDKLRNPSDAVKFAKNACELTKFSQPEHLDTLAAAYAAAGNFPEAIATAEKAVDLALSFRQKELAARIQKQLELYKSGTPYRE
jgi:hypothetical protein